MVTGQGYSVGRFFLVNMSTTELTAGCFFDSPQFFQIFFHYLFSTAEM